MAKAFDVITAILGQTDQFEVGSPHLKTHFPHAFERHTHTRARTQKHTHTHTQKKKYTHTHTHTKKNTHTQIHTPPLPFPSPSHQVTGLREMTPEERVAFRSGAADGDDEDADAIDDDPTVTPDESSIRRWTREWKRDQDLDLGWVRLEQVRSLAQQHKSRSAVLAALLAKHNEMLSRPAPALDALESRRKQLLSALSRNQREQLKRQLSSDFPFVDPKAIQLHMRKMSTVSQLRARLRYLDNTERRKQGLDARPSSPPSSDHRSTASSRVETRASSALPAATYEASRYQAPWPGSAQQPWDTPAPAPGSEGSTLTDIQQEQQAFRAFYEDPGCVMNKAKRCG